MNAVLYIPSRRSLMKGAAWATPVMIVSTTVPAYAASSKVEYELSAGWSASAKTSQGDCANGETHYLESAVNSWDVDSGKAQGFNVHAWGGTTESTTVTLNSFTIEFALPRYIDEVEVVRGDYNFEWDYPITINGVDMDILRFTFIGNNTFESSPEGTVTPAWPGSVLDTMLTINTDTCFPVVDNYYARFSFDYDTANGYHEDYTSAWIQTPMISA